MSTFYGILSTCCFLVAVIASTRGDLDWHRHFVVLGVLWFIASRQEENK